MPDEKHILLQRARELQGHGKLADAEALRLRLEVEILLDREDERSAECLNNLNRIAFLAICVDDFDQGERAARKCVERSRKAGLEGEKFATYLFMLAMALAENRKFDEAVKYGEEAIKIFSRNHVENDKFVRDRGRDLDRMRSKDTQPYLERCLPRK